MSLTVEHAVKASGENVTSVTTSGVATTSGWAAHFTATEYDASLFSSVSDNGSHSWTQRGSTLNITDNGLDCMLRRYDNLNLTGSGSHTFTQTASASEYMTCHVMVFSGQDANGFDKQAGQTGTGTALSSGATAATTTANQLIIGSCAFEGDSNYEPTVVVGSGYTIGTEEEDWDLYQPGGNEYKIVSSTGAQTATFTISLSNGWACAVDTYKEGATLSYEQEGFQFRDDDGNETGATDNGAQDAHNTSQAKESNFRLRILTDITGDAPNEGFEWVYKLKTDSEWRFVPVGQPSAVSIVGSTSNGATAAGTTGLTITKPSSLADGDVLFCVVQKDDDPGGNWASSGWAHLANQATTGGRDMNSSILRKLITNAAGEPSNYTFTNTNGTSEEMSGCIIAIRGLDQNVIEDVAIASSNGINDDTPDAPSVTSVHNDCLILTACCLNNNNGADPITFNAPTGFTLEESENSNNFRAMTAFAQKTLATPGATGAINWPNTADTNVAEWHTYTLALRPAPVIYISPSTHIPASGANTTAQLTAPSGKTTGDFGGGRIQDDENPTDNINAGNDEYREDEACFNSTSTAQEAAYQLRLQISGGTVFDTYTVTPEVTFSAGSTYNESITLSGATSLTPTGPLVANPSLTLSLNSGVTPTGPLVLTAPVTLAALAGMTLGRTKTFDESITLQADSTAAESAGLVFEFSLALDAVSSLNNSAIHIKNGMVTLSAEAATSLTSTLNAVAALALQGQATISPTYLLTLLGSLTLAGQTSLTLLDELSGVIEETVNLSADASITSQATQELVASLALQAEALIASQATQAVQVALSLGANVTQAATAYQDFVAILTLNAVNSLTASSGVLLSGISNVGVLTAQQLIKNILEGGTVGLLQTNTVESQAITGNTRESEILE